MVQCTIACNEGNDAMTHLSPPPGAARILCIARIDTHTPRPPWQGPASLAGLRAKESSAAWLTRRPDLVQSIAMSEVTRILSAIDQGDPHAAEQLLPLVYEELRKLAAHKLAQEKPGQTLEATALVHEAYLRLVASGAASARIDPASGAASARREPHWSSRGHFFAAAAEAMRRILIEAARRKRLLPRGNPEAETAARPDDERWFLLADALTSLADIDAKAAHVAQLRLLAGFSVEEAAKQLGLSRATAYRDWDFARAWLADHLSDDSGNKNF
jgi:RNA polymerase sigma factor (sigma-70 family)